MAILHIRFRKEVTGEQIRALRESVGGRQVRRYDELEPYAGGLIRLIEIPDEQAADAMRIYLDSGLVNHAEWDGKVSWSVDPNDPIYDPGYEAWGVYYPQWGLKSGFLNCPAAWDTEQGSSGIIVAHLDSGVQEHFSNDRVEYPALNDFYVLDAEGNPTHSEMDRATTINGHGTGTASIIGATGNDGVGMAGVDWNSRIFAYCVGGAFPTTQATTDAIIAATDAGADIITMSLGTGAYSLAMRSAVAYAAANDVVLIASTGNWVEPYLTWQIIYPCGFPEVIAVGAISESHAYYANGLTGPDVDVMAPGVSVPVASKVGPSSHFLTSGTSLAAPHVAGLAALIRAAFPTADAKEVRARITATADRTTWNDRYGWGEVKADQALTMSYTDYDLPAPENVSVTVNAEGNNVVTWDPVPGATLYRVYRDWPHESVHPLPETMPLSETDALVATTSLTEYEDVNSNGKEYESIEGYWVVSPEWSTYRVTALDGTVESDYSEYGGQHHYDLSFTVFSEPEPLESDGGAISIYGSGEISVAEGVIEPIAGSGTIEVYGSGTIANVLPVAGSGAISVYGSGTIGSVSPEQDVYNLSFTVFSLPEPISGEGVLILYAEGSFGVIQGEPTGIIGVVRHHLKQQGVM